MSVSNDPLAIARSAAETAGPFADLLAERCGAIAQALRVGDDSDALTVLSATTEDLEHFLTFLVLAGSEAGGPAPDTAKDLADYRETLMGILESIQPALGDSDFVEVADALDDDLAVSLREYRSIDQRVQQALAA